MEIAFRRAKDEIAAQDTHNLTLVRRLEKAESERDDAIIQLIKKQQHEVRFYKAIM